MTDSRLRPLAAAGLTVLILALPAPAQVPELPAAVGAPATDAPAADELSQDAILARRAEVRQQGAELRRRTAAGGEGPAAEDLAALERIDRLLGLELRELRRAEELAAAAGTEAPADLEQKLGHPPPYSVADLDAVLAELEAAVFASALVAEQVAVSTRAIDTAADRLADAKQRLRLARDQVAAPPAGPHRLELPVRAAQEQLRLRRLQLQNARRDLELQDAREAGLGRMAGRLREALLPAAAELESILAELAERRRELEAELDAAPQRIADAEGLLAVAEEPLELDAEREPAAAARVDARRLELDAAQIRQEVLNLRRERLEQVSDLWRLRFQVLGGELAVRDLTSARKRVGAELEELERARRLTEVHLEERRLFLRLASERLASGSLRAAVRRPLEDQQDALERIIALYEEELEDLGRTARLARRLRDEVAALSGHVGLGERLGLVRDKLAALWRYEIAATDGRPITVAKVAGALLLILLGYLVAKVVSRRLERSVFPRLGLTHGAAVAFQTLIFYLLLVIFCFWALHLVSIPLTVFTVLGGVLAIGIGFGSQNIVNNFISGLIILAERPIKVGDLIDVDGTFGKVERIGPRSSQIRSGDNTHVIVPNSAFLEKNVLNWTMSDDVLRSSVDVGVAYGSPVDTVAELLRRAVAEEPTILEEPASEVLFMDFGDNALAFRAYFWVRVTRPLDLYRAQSRLRFRIDALFHQAGVVIAFPQRDVHLDSLKPVEVRLVGETPKANPDSPASPPAPAPGRDR